jgi:hypothetical protein
MTRQIYPAAQAVAEKVRQYFARRHAEERERGGHDLACPPDATAIEAVVDAAFWASLRREERYPPRISLAFVPPDDAGTAIRFERRLPLSPEALTRLAPAVERPGVHLGVWRDAETFYTWGATRTIPALCFVLEVIDPGLLVIKHRRAEESGKFVNVAVIEGDQIKVLDPRSVSLHDTPAVVASLLGFDPPPEEADSVNVLIQLAASMRQHGRGGSLLVVPDDTDAWRQSIIGPTYSMSPPYSELAQLIRENYGDRRPRRWQEALRRAVDLVGGLTAVDGATIITEHCELLAFGAKIARREGWTRIEQVVDTEPIEGVADRAVHPAELGGTRHMSAAQFGQDQRDSIALVASQDGRYTIFSWSPSEGAVRAYRVEALLL